MTRAAIEKLTDAQLAKFIADMADLSDHPLMDRAQSVLRQRLPVQIA